MSTATKQDLENLRREWREDRDRSAKRITALEAETDELRALVRGLRDQLAQHIGDERIAAISGEKRGRAAA